MRARDGGYHTWPRNARKPDRHGASAQKRASAAVRDQHKDSRPVVECRSEAHRLVVLEPRRKGGHDRSLGDRGERRIRQGRDSGNVGGVGNIHFKERCAKTVSADFAFQRQQSSSGQCDQPGNAAPPLRDAGVRRHRERLIRPLPRGGPCAARRGPREFHQPDRRSGFRCRERPVSD